MEESKDDIIKEIAEDLEDVKNIALSDTFSASEHATLVKIPAHFACPHCGWQGKHFVVHGHRTAMVKNLLPLFRYDRRIYTQCPHCGKYCVVKASFADEIRKNKRKYIAAGHVRPVETAEGIPPWMEQPTHASPGAALKALGIVFFFYAFIMAYFAYVSTAGVRKEAAREYIPIMEVLERGEEITEQTFVSVEIDEVLTKYGEEKVGKTEREFYIVRLDDGTVMSLSATWDADKEALQKHETGKLSFDGELKELNSTRSLTVMFAYADAAQKMGYTMGDDSARRLHFECAGFPISQSRERMFWILGISLTIGTVLYVLGVCTDRKNKKKKI